MVNNVNVYILHERIINLLHHNICKIEMFVMVIHMYHNDIECNFVSKKKLKVLHTLALRFFVYLLPSLTNEWPRTTL